MTTRHAGLLLALVFSPAAMATAGDEKPVPPNWPQFRGPHGSGVAPDGKKLPVHFGPQTNVVWKTPLPFGVSSPCVWGDFIFVTGLDKASNKLETLCLDRRKGQILWRRPAPAERSRRSTPSAA